MQGQYKVPGGKLVVADVAVANGQLAEVRISGDFFLEPDHALDAINQALTGLPSDSDGETMAAAITRALPPDTTMFGVDAAAIAVAVGRALTGGGTP